MAYILRKIRCPRHFMLKYGVDPRTGMAYRPFKMQINPTLRNLPEWAFVKWPTIMRYVPIKRRGQKIRDDSSFYQPLMSAAFFVHQVYDPKNFICKMKCRGRCMEGLGKQDHTKNKRLAMAGATS